jgi:hypothetical protein
MGLTKTKHDVANLLSPTQLSTGHLAKLMTGPY